MSNKIFFTPGPAQVYFTLESHIKEAFKQDIPSISHRGVAFQKLFQETREHLSALLNVPAGYEIYFTSSANEIWERIIQNLVRSHSHHFVNGSFSQKFYDFAVDYQKSPTITKADPGREFDHFEIPEETELIAVTLNETSTGYSFDSHQIEVLRSKHPEKLLALDAVSAFPSVPFDLGLVDTAYFSVQKCFGLPAGLGVWILNKRCIEKNEQLEKEGIITGSYHKLSALRKNGQKNQTPETPNVLYLYLLGKIARDLLERGVQALHNETVYKSTLLYQCLEEKEGITPFINTKTNRSKTVIVAEVTGGNESFIKSCEARGWIIGKGYGDFKQAQIRIANFPTHSKEVFEQLCDHISRN